jgi:hypothetical protein
MQFQGKKIAWNLRVSISLLHNSGQNVEMGFLELGEEFLEVGVITGKDEKLCSGFRYSPSWTPNLGNGVVQVEEARVGAGDCLC